MNRDQKLVITIAVLASFVSFLDGTIINVALPAIAKELGGGITTQQWVVDAYLITLGALILVAGSGMARLTLLPTLRAFLPSDAVIRGLAASRDQDARLTSIYPRFDPNVPEGSHVQGATNVEIPVVGHFRVLDAPPTIAAVIAAVEREVATPG